MTETVPSVQTSPGTASSSPGTPGRLERARNVTTVAGGASLSRTTAPPRSTSRKKRVLPAHRQRRRLVGEQERIRKLEDRQYRHVYRLGAERVHDVALFV
ncbi:MAG: hypothetical protein OXG04_01460 [Acidobacteria bacterium]|nr:hypothetical protein [Acidobacteriota bacterium]